MTSAINGLILSGGKSTRMGKDKGLVDYHGRPQREHLIEILKPFCGQVFTSLPKSSKVSPTTIPDHFDLDSPLNGILSAFHFDPEVAWLTVPIDMPNIDADSIQFLMKHRNKTKMATCFSDSDDEHPEPLFTIWEHAAKPALFDFFNRGGRSPRLFLLENEVQQIKPPKRSLLININTQDELTAYYQQHGKTGPGKK